MITASTAEKLEAINSYSPFYKDLIGVYGKSVAEQLFDQGLIYLSDKKHVILTTYGQSELTIYRAQHSGANDDPILTADIAARLETIDKYSPPYDTLVSAFGESVAVYLSDKGLISVEDKSRCTLTDYARTELAAYRAANPAAASEDPSKYKESSAWETTHMPPFLHISSIVTLLDYFDTEEVQYDFLEKYARKKNIEKLFSYRLISVENGICVLTDRGRAILEKGMEENLLHANPYRFSVASVLCAVLMFAAAALQLYGMFIDFDSNFVSAEKFAIIDVQYMALQLPRNICICLGALLYWVSIGISSRKLSLAAVILFTCAFFCWPHIYVGIACLLVFILGIIGYIRSGRE